VEQEQTQKSANGGADRTLYGSASMLDRHGKSTKVSPEITTKIESGSELSGGSGVAPFIFAHGTILSNLNLFMRNKKVGYLMSKSKARGNF